jgi:predicted O-linked N-acetylglucosamine transferase (SPINDLY family)
MLQYDGPKLKGPGQDPWTACRQALRRNAKDPQTLQKLGMMEWRAGRPAAGAELLRRAIRIQPKTASLHNDLGMVLSAQDQTAHAAAALRQAVALYPTFAEALNNLGTVLRRQGKLDEAIASYRRAVQVRADFVEAYYNLANALRDQRKLDEAIDSYRRAVVMRPVFSRAWSNLGVALKDVGLIEYAVECTRRSLSIRPDLIAASNLLCTMHYSPAYTPAQILEEQRRYEATYARPFEKFRKPHTNDRSPERRLRVGYVSPDLSSHPVGCAMLPILRHRDRQNFETVCYSDARHPDPITKELAGLADVWHDTANVSDEELAGKICADDIDILIDLAGHTNENRLPVFARRPAPVQVTWLGWPGTTGMVSIDYRLSDRHLDPVNGQVAGSAEKVVWLENGFLPFEPPSDAPDSLNKLPALKSRHVTFASFNNFCKVTTNILELWARVLSAVEHSRLILITPPGQSRERVLHQMPGLKDRIDFLNRQSFRQYLETYRRVDIVLDTAPFNGYATSLDALWMGVPVVTLAGAIPPHRGGVSLLSNLGLEELVGNSEDEYVQIATTLALDLTRLAELRSGMRARLSKSAIMSGRRYVADLERALRQMWRKWCTG